MNEKKENISLLQSRGWSLFQRETMGKTIERISTDAVDGLVIKSPIGFGNYYAYAPYGPAGIYTSKSLRLFVDKVSSSDVLRKTFFLRIEPFLEYSEEVSQALISAGFRKVPAVQPEETMILDIRPTEKELLSGMEHNTRYSIRSAERRGVTIRMHEGKDIPEESFSIFWNLFVETNKKHALVAYPKKYYRGIFSLHDDCSTKLYIAHINNKPIASAVIVFFKNRATYLHAASIPGFGKYNAPTYLLWNAIQDAKRLGHELFDFWGVSTTKKKWAGVTAFKKSFGGPLVRYQGTWDYVFNLPKYTLYRTIKKYYESR